MFFADKGSTLLISPKRVFIAILETWVSHFIRYPDIMFWSPAESRRCHFRDE